MNKTTVTKTTAFEPVKVTDNISLSIETRERDGKTALSGKITKTADDGSTNEGFIDINSDRDTLMVNIRNYSALGNETFKTLLTAIADSVVSAMGDSEETDTKAETEEE